MVRVSSAEAGAAKPRVLRAAVAATAKTNLRMSSLLQSWEANAENPQLVPCLRNFGLSLAGT
jgi:hypothetical protein